MKREGELSKAAVFPNELTSFLLSFGIAKKKQDITSLEVKEINDKLFIRLMRKLIKIWNIHRV